MTVMIELDDHLVDAIQAARRVDNVNPGAVMERLLSLAHHAIDSVEADPHGSPHAVADRYTPEQIQRLSAQVQRQRAGIHTRYPSLSDMDRAARRLRRREMEDC